MRSTLTAVITTILAVCFFYLSSILPDTGIAVREAGKWAISATGWDVLTVIPVWVATLPISLIFTSVIIYFLYQYSHKSDFQRLHDKYELKHELLQEISRDTDIKNKKALEIEFRRAKDLQTEAQKIKNNYESKIDNAITKIKNSEEQAKIADIKTQRAEKKCRNAAGAAERKRRKLTKVMVDNNLNHKSREV